MERRFKEFGDRTGGAVAHITAKAQELGATAAHKANEAATVVGEKIGSLANVIRENVPHEGAMGTAATAVVDGLESASSYLQEKKFDHLAKDVTALVRTYPVQSLLIGPGIETMPKSSAARNCADKLECSTTISGVQSADSNSWALW